MHNAKRLFGASLALVCATLTSRARATTEIPALYDARSVGMGGTGVSFQHNGASIWLNPGTLEGIKTVAITAGASLFSSKPSGPSPFFGPAAPESKVEADGAAFPLPFVGGAYRVAPPLVIGLAAFPAMGVGGEIKNATPDGQSLKLTILSIEVSPAVSYAITDNLAIGVAYRISRFSQSVHFPGSPPPPQAPQGTPPTPPTDASLSGYNFLGAQVGLYFHPSEQLKFGLVYRSRTKTTLTGTTTGGPFPPDGVHTSVDVSTPDAIKAGGSYSALDDRLLVALDLKYLFYSQSNEDLTTHFDTPSPPFPPGGVDQKIVQKWKNVFQAMVGGEYRVTPMFPIRLGFQITSSATNRDYANVVFTPPTWIPSVHAGVGLRFDSLDIDLGGYYAHASTHVDAGPSSGTNTDEGRSAAIAGTYATTLLMGSLTATYHH